MKRTLCLFLIALFALGCFVSPTSATAQDEASAANGVLLLIAGNDGKVDDFLYISRSTAKNELTIQQLPADQDISVSPYKEHVLANPLTLHKVFLLGQAWEGEAMAIDFSTVAAQSSFGISPAHTILISHKEDSPDVIAEVLSQLHIAAVSADPLAALGRILVGIAQLDDAAQNQLIAFIADNTEADVDADTICTYLTELISGCDGCTISVSPAA